jgi:hypothetical protein
MKTRLHSASGITAVSDDGPRPCRAVQAARRCALFIVAAWLREVGDIARRVNRFNRVLVGLRKAGLKLGAVQILTTTDRRTGQPRRVPVGLVERDGQRDLVQTYPNAARVANARANDAGNLSHGRHSDEIRLVEVPVEDRRQLLLQHLQNSPPRAGKLLVKTGLWTVPARTPLPTLPNGSLCSASNLADKRRSGGGGCYRFSISASTITTSTWVVLRCLSEMCL